MTELQWKRSAIRMLHSVCPAKREHDRLAHAEHCSRCGLSGDDYHRFVVGDEGKRSKGVV